MAEELGLSSYTCFSMELLVQITELATKMPYREVVKTFQLLKGIYITKDTVLKTVNLASKYYKVPGLRKTKGEVLPSF